MTISVPGNSPKITRNKNQQPTASFSDNRLLSTNSPVKILTADYLVTYATRFGSTAEVAEVIAGRLADGEHTVDCRPMADVQTLEGYQAVLIGSAVNFGKWLPEAVEFIITHQAALGRMPVGLFTVHIQNIADDPESRKRRLAYLDGVRSYIQPVSEGYFAGKFDRRAARELLPNWLAWFVPTLDFRKWEKVSAWADSVRPLLVQMPVAAGQQFQLKGENHVAVNA